MVYGEEAGTEPASSGFLLLLCSRLQELYYEIVNVLSLMLEDMPKESSSSLSGLS